MRQRQRLLPLSAAMRLCSSLSSPAVRPAGPDERVAGPPRCDHWQKHKGSKGSFRGGSRSPPSASERARPVPNDAAPLRRLRRNRCSHFAWCVTPFFPAGSVRRSDGEEGTAGHLPRELRRRTAAACSSTDARAALAPRTSVARRGASDASLRRALCDTETRVPCVEEANARRSVGGALRTGGASLAREASAMLCRASDARRRGDTGGEVGTSGVVTRRAALLPAQA